MADIVSCDFKEGKHFFSFNNLTTYFNHHFPLPQNEYWIECNIPTEWVSWVIACLSGKQLQMAWLKIPPKISKNTGIIGVTTPISAKSILSATTSLSPSNAMSLLQNLLLGSVQACMEKRYNQSSRSNGHSCAHLQDHPIGWKTKSPLQGIRKIPADHPAHGGRITIIWPSICYSTRGTDYSSTALIQSGTTIHWCSCTYLLMPIHHCLLLSSARWWIHQTSVCHEWRETR